MDTAYDSQLQRCQDLLCELEALYVQKYGHDNDDVDEDGCLPHTAILIDIIIIVSILLYIQGFQLAEQILTPLKLAVVCRIHVLRLCIFAELLMVQALDLR